MGSGGSAVKVNMRRDAITDLVNQAGSITVEELAEQLNASRETIRRDLNLLVDRGHIRKYHGGASALMPTGENAFHLRMGEMAGAKRLIARQAAALFKPGDTLFVDTGSTTVYFAEELSRAGRISAITNSTAIARLMHGAKNANQVFLIGGEYAGDASETVGQLALTQIAQFHADHVVLTIGGLSADVGATDFDIKEAEVARAMLAQARTLTILADTAKLGRTALFEVCPISRIDRLVTEDGVYTTPADIAALLNAPRD